jgi:crotonobetaine/carnitine-CoA ligase
VGDEDVLVAVVPRAGQVVDAGQLITYLRDIVPRFAVPRYVRVVPALPKTLVTMRVQKQAIRTEGVTPDTWDQATGLMAAATSPAPR